MGQNVEDTFAVCKTSDNQPCLIDIEVSNNADSIKSKLFYMLSSIDTVITENIKYIEKGLPFYVKLVLEIKNASKTMALNISNSNLNANDMLILGGLQIGFGIVTELTVGTLASAGWTLVVSIGASLAFAYFITEIYLTLKENAPKLWENLKQRFDEYSKYIATLIENNVSSLQDFTSNVIDKITSWVDEFDVNDLIIQGNHSNGEIQYNPSHPYANPQRNLDSKDYQSLIELLLHKDSNANDIDALLRTFPNYLANPANQNNKNDSIKSNIATSNASNAICMNIKAQCFNHKNEILANKEIYVYSPNFNAFVDRAKSDNNGFIEFNNACVSSKMTNSDLYFVLNRYGLDEEQKDFHIKISPFKTIQPKDKKVKQLVRQKLIFDKHIPKAIESNDTIKPNIKVISIEFIQDNQTNSPPNNNAFDNSQKSKYFITLKANYDIRDSQKKHIKGDKDKYLNDSIVMHQHKTQWGYIVFDKDEDIDKSLMEITKTTPLIYSKKFKRLDNIKGQRVRLPFRDEWEDKQVRFFAYLWRPSKNVGIDVEIREINYVVIYNENIEQKSFFDNITWQDVAIEIILLHPIVRGVNVIFKFGKWGLSFLGKTKINQKVAKQYSQKKIVIKKSKKAKSKTNNISEVKLNSLPKDTQEAYYGYKRHNWRGTFTRQNKEIIKRNEIRASGRFNNKDNMLPQKPNGTYKKFDIANRHDPRRFVRDIENGDIYYTTDHYKTFVKIIE